MNIDCTNHIIMMLRLVDNNVNIDYIIGLIIISLCSDLSITIEYNIDIDCIYHMIIMYDRLGEYNIL